MNGKRYSRQRELIYEALRQTEQHPTAEMIYQWLNLNLLADEGAIRRMAFPVERYDAKTMPHPHFCCDQCGAVYDLHLPYDAELDRQALLASGHDVTGHEVVFHGICTKCKQLH